MRVLLYTTLTCIVLAAALPAVAEDDEAAGFRDPFWPVGYSPKKNEPPPPPKVEEKKVVVEQKPAPKPPEPVPQPDWAAALRCLKISGYAELNGSRNCVINGKTVSEGEKISIAFNGFRYTWRIETIAAQKSQMRFTRLAVATLPKE